MTTATSGIRMDWRALTSSWHSNIHTKFLVGARKNTVFELKLMTAFASMELRTLHV
jgi:hypothetical protein